MLVIEVLFYQPFVCLTNSFGTLSRSSLTHPGFITVFRSMIDDLIIRFEYTVGFEPGAFQFRL